jgi:hypothetical protein
VLLPEFDGVGGAREVPSVGAIADVGDDDVIDEVVLELVVGELVGRPQLLDRVPLTAGGVEAQGRPVGSRARVRRRRS